MAFTWRKSRRSKSVVFNNPEILGLAFLGGTIPALIWLWFWLKQEQKRPEPRSVLASVFIVGMASVMLVIPIQKFLMQILTDHRQEIITWAFVEELIKYLVVIVLLNKSKHIEDPIDWPIYLMTAGLGFAAFENTLFLIKPLSLGQDTVTLLTGGLRFLGSTLLHAVSSALIGIALGLSFYMKRFWQKTYMVFGLLLATALHSLFNFFIINQSGGEFLRTFAFLWVVTIIIMLLFEKVRRMGGEY